jgi:hypothetical protein
MEAEISEEDRTNETGLFHTAESYWKSAKALEKAGVDATHALYPVLFLYYHAIELYLKSFLRANGHSAKELSSRKFGHDIGNLTTRATNLGLWYMDEDKEVFEMMVSTDAVIRSRYIRTGAFSGWPSPDMLDRTCCSLRASIAKDLKAKGKSVRL